MTPPTTIVPPGERGAPIDVAAAPGASAGVRTAPPVRPNPYCPFLGMSADPDALSLGPSSDQLCIATEPLTPVSLQHQAVFCLGASHVTCSRFQQRSQISAPARSSRTTLVSIVALAAAFLASALVTVFVVGNPLTVEPAPSTATQAAAATTIASSAVATQPTAATTVASPAAAVPVATQAAPATPASAATVPATPTATAPPANGRTYTVQSGDTLTSIAARNGVTVAQLMAANNLSSDFLRLGQELRVPASSATPTH